MSESVGLVDAHPVDHFPSEFGNDMEQIIDHTCLGAMMLNFQIHRSIHVHRHRFDLCTGLCSQPFKEGAYCSPATAFANPQYLLRIGINDHGGVTVTLEQGELIHDEPAELASIGLRDFTFETLMVDGLDRMPV